MTQTSRAPAVELIGLVKEFAGCRANDGITLTVERGTIHGVIGENGAGKSTAMKMLFGLYRPDSGEIKIHGNPCQWNSPRDAIQHGIGMVHQHFMLADPYSALENAMLGPSAHRFALALNPIRSARARLQKLSNDYGLEVNWDAPIEEMPVGIQQRIEILKLLDQNAEILILDEPTAVLTPQETQSFFENLKKLKSQGKTILIITHKLKEVMAITDRVTVFRAGKVTGEVKTSETSPQQLADLMVGRKVMLDVKVEPPKKLGSPAILAKNLVLKSTSGGKNPLNDVSFEVRAGEIVGIAGVEGNGQSELMQAIFHPSEKSSLSSGQVEILGKDVTGWKTSRIRKLGTGLVPEDRHKEGLLLESDLEDCFLLGHEERDEFKKRAWIRRDALSEVVGKAIETYDVRPRNPRAISGGLSGGNQQKLIVARELWFKPGFLVAAQPTRGVDVGAIEAIHRRIVRARDEGAGVLLVSSELDEILSLSDRILVMYEGRIVGEFARGKVSESELGLRMGGAAT